MTVLAPMDRKQYTDFLYEILKATQDWLGFRKIRNGDYRLLKSDPYKIAGIKEPVEETTSKTVCKTRFGTVKDKNEVIKELENYKRIPGHQDPKYHDIKCEYLVNLAAFSYSG